MERLGGSTMIQQSWAPLIDLNYAHVIMQEEVGLLATDEAATLLVALDRTDKATDP